MDPIEVYPEGEPPATWLNRHGSEVPISKLDDSSLLMILDRLYNLANVKKDMTISLYEGFKGAYFQACAKQLRTLDWGTFVDPVFRDLEYEAATRRLGWKPKPLSAEEKISLLPKGSLERYLVGALRDCIHAHGPVTKNNVSSATKRMIGAIKTYNHDREKK